MIGDTRRKHHRRDAPGRQSDVSRMKIVHVTESHEAMAGGIPAVVDQLARHTVEMGLDVDILSVGRDPLPPPAGAGLTNVPPHALGRWWGWSAFLNDRVRSLACRNGRQVFHLHGAWLASHWYAARAARKAEVPFIVSFHGQLEPYHWRDKGAFHVLKKKVYWYAVAYPAFRSASVVHAITPLEKQHLVRLFPTQRIEVIPNAVDLEEVDTALRDRADPIGTGRAPVIGFLGRFHPKKGAHLLIEAFSMAGLPREWQLVLAGPLGTPSYMAMLAELVKASPVNDRITFIGPVSGNAKWEFYRTATVIAVPSLSEVIGMVNLEAAACGTPTITTYETGLLDWKSGGGILIEPVVAELAAALSTICLGNTAEWQRRSLAARHLVESHYSWKVIRGRWLNLYGSVLHGDRE